MKNTVNGGWHAAPSKHLLEVLHLRARLAFYSSMRTGVKNQLQPDPRPQAKQAEAAPTHRSSGTDSGFRPAAMRAVRRLRPRAGRDRSPAWPPAPRAVLASAAGSPPSPSRSTRARPCRGGARGTRRHEARRGCAPGSGTSCGSAGGNRAANRCGSGTGSGSGGRDAQGWRRTGCGSATPAP